MKFQCIGVCVLVLVMINSCKKADGSAGPESSPDKIYEIAFCDNAEYSEGRLHLVHSDGTNNRVLLDSITFHTRIEWSPTGDQIVTFGLLPYGFSGKMMVIDKNQKSFYDLPNIKFGGAGHPISWSSSGTTIAGASLETPPALTYPFWFAVVTIDPFGGNKKILTPDSAYFSSPCFSPDGSLIACLRLLSSDSVFVYVMSSSGANLKRIGSKAATGFCWSPDNARIAYAGPTGLFTINADGSNEQRIVQRECAIDAAGWSPDGTLITYAINEVGYSEVFIINSNGTNPQNLSNDGSSNNSAWSPDGRLIAFNSLTYTSSETLRGVYTMKKDGSGKRFVARASLASSISWSPVPIQ